MIRLRCWSETSAAAAPSYNSSHVLMLSTFKRVVSSGAHQLRAVEEPLAKLLSVTARRAAASYDTAMVGHRAAQTRAETRLSELRFLQLPVINDRRH